MREETRCLGIFKIEDLYSGRAVAKIHMIYNSFKSIASLRLLNDEKVPDCCIIENLWEIELRTEKGIKGEKYESIEELIQDCYDKLKKQSIVPIAIVVSDLVYKHTYPFINENKTKNAETTISIEEDIELGYGIKIIPSCDLLVMPKSFAKNNLSHDAISLAEDLDKYYIWTLRTTAWVVLFELPKIFDTSFQKVLPGLIKYNLEYLRKNNLHDNIVFHIFTKNLEKKIIS